MLKQLLKYEFKATGRTYGGLYLALVALAVLSGFSLRSSSKDNFASLLLFAYMIVAVAVAVVSVVCREGLSGSPYVVCCLSVSR